MRLRWPSTGPRAKRPAILALTAVVFAAAASATWLGLAYPGLSELLLADLRHGDRAETTDRFRFLAYYFDGLDRLRRDGERVEIPPPPPGRQAFEAGFVHFHRGAFDAAVRSFEEALESEGQSETTLFWLAQALMRRAEAENCLSHLESATPGSPDHPTTFGDLGGGGVCALPVTVPHHRPASIERAAVILERLLERSPDDPLYRWLLNFAYMARGRYPDGVPEEHLLETEFTDIFYGETARRAGRRFAHLSLRDRAADLGVDLLDAGKGVAVEDFDGDGDLDLVTGGTYGGLHLYLNEAGPNDASHDEASGGRRRFVDVTQDSGLEAVSQPFVVSTADYDGDGAMDLFVSRPFHHFRLLRNDGTGRFRDVTYSAGLLQPGEPDRLAHSSFVSAWGDVNNDGRLDLVVTQYGMEMPLRIHIYDRPFADTRLYVNQGDGRFADRTAAFGLSNVVADRMITGAAFGDYDDDGRLDLFLSAYTPRRSRLLRNQGGRTFVDSGLVDHPETGFTAAFLDLDHDGDLDLFQGGQSPARTATARAVLRRSPELDASRIFRNAGGSFETRPDLFVPPIAAGTMGAGFGDLDNDGCHDVYLGTGNPESWYVLPNLLYVGERDGTRCTGRLLNASMLWGVGTIQKGHGIVFFDFDEDGDQDVYSSLGGMWQGDAWPNQMWVNESSTGHTWTKIRLRGRESNRWGLGARITVEATNEAGETIRRHHLMDQGTGFGSGPYLAHVGLLDAVRIERVTVRWLGSGCVADYPAELERLNRLDEAECLAADP